MRKIVLFVLSGLILASCRFLLFSDKDQVVIMETAFNSAMKQDSGLNTPCNWIDLSVRRHFSKAAISDFLKANKNVAIINSDSLFNNDSTWIRYGYLPQMLLKINRVYFFPHSVSISLEKILATDGSAGIEIILKRNKSGFQVVRSGITMSK